MTSVGSPPGIPLAVNLETSQTVSLVALSNTLRATEPFGHLLAPCHPRRYMTFAHHWLTGEVFPTAIAKTHLETAG
jgi:hypothetical protein